MKNPSEKLFNALRMMRNNSYVAFDTDYGIRRMPSNSLLYYQAERMAIEAQEEIGRKNKTIVLKEMAKYGIK